MTRKLFYLVTEDWYFYSHRLPMARAAIRAGYDVYVICRVDQHRERIEAEGIKVIPLSLDRRSLNPLSAMRQIMSLTKIYRTQKPDIVHHIAMKPILYGSIAALFSDIPHVLNAFAGLGFVFRSEELKARLIRSLLICGFRFLLCQKQTWTLFQNADDQVLMVSYGLVDLDRSFIIRGSGVDISAYHPEMLPASPPFVCIYAGRMIDMKGLPTLQEAFSILQKDSPDIHLWLCGKPDPDTPGAWTDSRLKDWCAQNPNVIWLGHQDKMAEIWPKAHLALQPTWGGEGLPKTLLEAGACARAMVASDVSGNREVVIPGRNGILVPERNAQALAAAILEIKANPDFCAAMGAESRKIVESDMSAQAVGQQITDLYARMMV